MEPTVLRFLRKISISLMFVFVASALASQRSVFVLGGGATTFTDTFTRAAANPLSGSWGSLGGVSSTGNLQIISSGNVGSSSTATNSMEYSTQQGSWSNDQFSQVVISTVSNSGRLAGAAVRLATGAYTGYFGYYQNGFNCRIEKRVAATQTVLFTSAGSPCAPLTLPATLKITAQGTTITLFINGTSIGSVTDASVTSGAPGIYINSTSNSDSIVTSWTGGTL